MPSSPLLHVHFTSSPWRKWCTEFTLHSPTLVTSVLHTSKMPFLRPPTDEGGSGWVGQLFSLHWVFAELMPLTPVMVGWACATILRWACTTSSPCVVHVRQAHREPGGGTGDTSPGPPNFYGAPWGFIFCSLSGPEMHLCPCLITVHWTILLSNLRTFDLPTLFNKEIWVLMFPIE